MNLLGKKILAEVLPSESKTENGVIIPDKLNLEKHRAEIVKVGPDVEYYRVGQVIQFNQHSAHYYPVRGTECVFLREDQDVIALVSESLAAYRSTSDAGTS